jgi:hypothetical protein
MLEIPLKNTCLAQMIINNSTALKIFKIIIYILYIHKYLLNEQFF